MLLSLCFSPSGSHLLVVAGSEQEGADRAVFIGASDATRVPVEVKRMADIQQLAWAAQHVAIASGNNEARILCSTPRLRGQACSSCTCLTQVLTLKT